MKLGCCDLTPHPHPPQDGRDLVVTSALLVVTRSESRNPGRSPFRSRLHRNAFVAHCPTSLSDASEEDANTSPFGVPLHRTHRNLSILDYIELSITPPFQV